MHFHQLPTELVDHIFVWACRIPVAPPGSYSYYTCLTGVGDAATTTNLMCVARHFYALLAPLLYRAPFLVYPRQIARLDRTLVHRPALAPLMEHLHMRECPIEAVEEPAARGYGTFGVTRGTFPLHTALETDAVELGALCGAFIDPTCERHADGGPASRRHWIDGAEAVRAFLAWLRCVAAFGARDAVQPSDIPLLEARARDAAEELMDQYRLAADEKDSRLHTELYRERVRAIPAAAGMRFGQVPVEDIGAEMPALHALHLDAYNRLDPALPRWLRLTAARALAYGRLKGVTDSGAYAAYLTAPHFSVWRDRDAAAEPWTAEFRSVPDAQFRDTPFTYPLTWWYAVMPGTWLSPQPVATTFTSVNLAISRILAMSASVRTLACTFTRWLDTPALTDALPALETLIINSALPDTTHGPLLHVRTVVNAWPIALEDVRRAFVNVLMSAERYTRICDDGYMVLDRRVEGQEAPAGLSPLTDGERAFIGELGSLAPHIALLYLAWLRAAADPTA